MNHLAHVVLAGSDEGLRLGAFLGDHVKGRKVLEELPPSWAAGVELHRRIDSFSDGHPAVVGLLERLEPPWRRYGGVIFDILFDYMLTRHWSRFGPTGLEQLAGEIDDLLARHQTQLPPRLVRFSHWARTQGLWQRYGERAMLEKTFSLLAYRHGHRWPLADGIRLLDEHERAIERAFLTLFPDLLARAAEDREQLYCTWSSM